MKRTAAEVAPRPRRRTKILVDPALQFRMIGRLLLMLAADMAVLGLLVVALPIAISAVQGDTKAGLDEAWERAQALRIWGIPLAVTFLLMSLQGVREVFRVAGPSYRFRVTMASVAQGKVPRGVAIRKDDYLQDTCAAMNAALVSVHDRFTSLKEQAGALRFAAERCREVPDEAAWAALDGALERVAGLLDGVECTGVPAPAGNRTATPAELAAC